MKELNFIDEAKIHQLLENNQKVDSKQIDDILTKVLELKGLTIEESAVLLNIQDQYHLEKLFHTALQAKQEIYGNRLVLFAPLYVSNFCSNNCLYCGFRADNKEIHRRTLSLDEVREETKSILEQGHKRILMLMGENHQDCSFDYFMDTINAAYSAVDSKGSSIRRINIEIAPLSNEELQKLSKIPIGTYTVFQETYHQDTYKIMHPSGKKADYFWRLNVMDRALANGLHDVGIGALFGLYDYRFDTLGLLQHAKHLDSVFNVGPHTISIPRINAAKNTPMSVNIPHRVSDLDFKKLVAVIRCSVPYTGMILSTRESVATRTELLNLGVSQISAGSRTNPGGYKQAFAEVEEEGDGQFSLNDPRSSGEVIKDVIQQGFIPSFCTGCYRLGRVGQDFMDQAKPGLIKLFCHPNALTTLKEYLVDYADDETKELGESLIQRELNNIPDDKVRNITIENLNRISKGERDLYI